MIEIILSGRRLRGKGAPTFEARVFGGDTLCRSHTPIYEAARELIRRGHDESEMLTAYHEGSLTAINKPANLGRLARWTVSEGDRGMWPTKWRPYEGPK